MARRWQEVPWPPTGGAAVAQLPLRARSPCLFIAPQPFPFSWRRGLWAIGCLAILTAICGCIGGCRVRWCLGVYVVLAVLALAGQLGFVLYLFIAPDQAEEQLSNYQRTKDGQIK